MAWLQDHWLGVFTAWVALNTVLSPIAAKVPVTGFFGKALHIFVAVSPMDLMKAIKTVGAELSVPLAMLCVAILAVSCATVAPLEQYRTDSLDCIAKATTKAEADLCRAAVEIHYCGDGGALADAGACVEGGAQ